MRAKMTCTAVTDYKLPDGEKYSETVSLMAVYGKDGTANASWSKATPAGSVNLTISNPAAWGHFKQGGHYFVDFFETTEEG